MRALTPMTFYNLDKKQVVEYQLNIAENFNYIQRFDLDIPEIPNYYFQVYADVYDDNDQQVDDALLFISYYDEDFILDAIRKIRELRTPEVEEYRINSENAILKYMLDNNVVEKVIEQRKRKKMENAKNNG